MQATRCIDSPGRWPRALSQRAGDQLIEGFPRTLVFLSTVDATVSVDAVVDHLLEHLAAGEHELVLFDINRYSRHTSIMVADPGPLTSRLLTSDTLPFHLTLVSNETADSRKVIGRVQGPYSNLTETRALGMAWPEGVLSLSHVALPFPPNDLLYGEAVYRVEDRVHLGENLVQGERNLLTIPASFLLRLRYNPFYDYVERRSLEWVTD